MKELRQAQAQAKVEKLARSSSSEKLVSSGEAAMGEKLVEARSSGEAARGEKLVEAEARNENLARSLGQAEAKVEK